MLICVNIYLSSKQEKNHAYLKILYSNLLKINYKN